MRGGDKGGDKNNVLRKLAAAGLTSDQIRGLAGGAKSIQRKQTVTEGKEARLRRAAGRRLNTKKEDPNKRGRENYRGGTWEGDILNSNNPKSIPNRLANAGENALRSQMGKGVNNRERREQATRGMSEKQRKRYDILVQAGASPDYARKRTLEN